ncbi:Bug family tripartite tricarboxylate transporter substrate binding protein [Consotaella salsifontis]|uniref:Tripartite-type tricarboxylate transporter, receptor component TctC n=1 Tax=Consotaella salsifontis TaxID=1365950 RepID=A0A1T4N2S9_9HYPH|nr:tripartite tricarboxylate transporter substrate binding protein [Consotaella salsifontis]SJZ73416.1 Tripartite-type tricarboxylate transporter, receptor component TctC [Consotaella salsifontis]
MFNLTRRRAISGTIRAVAGAIVSLAVASTALTATSQAALADDFPTKPIKVIVPYKPGGRTDVVARMIADKIQQKGWLEQPLVIVNADGGAGANAFGQLKRGGNDGYTIMHWSHELLLSVAMGLGGFQLDDFKSIGFTGGGSPLWAVREDAPYKTLNELIDHLKKEPRSLVEAVAIGSIPHIVGAMLEKSAGVETRYVTANSNADRLRLLLGGNADIALFAASEFMRQGENLRPLVYFGNERLAALPDLPTAKELGYDASWANPNWWLAPAGTPDDVVKKIAGALEKAINDPEIAEYFKNNTLEPYWTGGDEAMDQSVAMLASLKSITDTLK